jgi:hypothetical protein
MLEYLYGTFWLENSLSLLAQAIFEPKLFPMNTPSFLNTVILHLSAYENGTEFSETWAYKIQTPGNYPEEAYNTTKMFCFC